MTRRGNPNMVKGAPSINPSGTTKAASAAPGSDGVMAYGGFLATNEGSSDLTGSTRWKTMANMWRRPPVAIWGRLRQALLGGVTWTAEGEDERAVEIVTQGMLEAELARPWSLIAARSINGAAAYGFSIHATALGRTSAGSIGYADIAHRPQHTIERWYRERDDDETTPFVRIEQRLAMGKAIPIDLDDCLYLANDNGTLSDSPEGVGMLRLIAEHVRRLNVYEPLEGSELASSMGGIPITRVPLEEIAASARVSAEKDRLDDTGTVSRIAAAITASTSAFSEFVAKRFKDPSKLAWFRLDSATYRGKDPNVITGTPKWGVEIVKGELQGLTEMRAIIRDLDLDIARMLGVEHVFMGGGDTAGTYGAHESKITALAASLNAEIGAFAHVARGLARRIVVANGLPASATPKLVPSPVTRADVLKAVQAITQLSMANLPADHPAHRAVFEAVDLPYMERPAPTLTLPGFGQPRPEMPTLEDILDEPDAKPVTTTTEAAPVEPAAALNGAQVASMVDTISAVTEGRIARESGVAILEVAFNLDTAAARRLLGPESFTPTVTETAPVAAAKAKSTEHPLYSLWEQMRQRCTNENNKDYADYGGRGIRVCDRWDDFDLFVDDMGARPSDKHTLERLNNDGDYKPSNCEWATMFEQNENRR